ncbi:hypothetical protein [Janthinobacterium sp. DSP2-3-3]|uniref:hypothetical protein n=1 Tax=Janthinobacterium sp. DSP2-3-3 TaxID=2804596 RepID=UPI003CFB68ED
MKNKKYWKNNGTKENPIYDFIYPISWSEEEILKENEENIEKIKGKKCEWVKQLENMPKNIMSAAISEIKNGNVLKSISNNNWPNNGSIVVSFRDKFHEENKKLNGVQWRELNDPHYCKEEIAEIFNKTEYLLIH